MKKVFIYSFLVCFFYSLSFGHSVVLKTIDNGDGTMEIFGGFSTGASAAGAKLKIKSQIDSKILYENRIPSLGTLIVNIPNEPYTIILDSGPGHRVEKSGDILPKEGFTQELSKPLEIAFLTTLFISIGFIIASIFLSRKKLKNIS